MTLRELITNIGLWEKDEHDEEILGILKQFSDEEIHTIRDSGKNGFVHLCALYNSEEVLEYLIRTGADLNLRNGSGKSPLDIAMHWCHYDIAVQLQHFGGKHSYEQERDIAIAQRDIAQGQVDSAVIKMEHAVSVSMQHTQQNQVLQAERDRAVAHVKELIAERDIAMREMRAIQKSKESLGKRVEELEMEKVKMKEEVRIAEVTQQNAIRGWEAARQHAQETEKACSEALERTNQAYTIRDDALVERDAARDLTQQAEKQKALAQVHQHRAEEERDRANQERHDAAKKIQKKIQYWTEIVVKAEEERRNINREIQLQTESLKADLRRHQQELRKGQDVIDGLKLQISNMKVELESNTAEKEATLIEAEKLMRKNTRLESDMKLIAAARKKERKMHLDKQFQEVHEQVAEGMTSIMNDSLHLWNKLSSLVQGDNEAEEVFQPQDNISPRMDPKQPERLMTAPHLSSGRAITASKKKKQLAPLSCSRTSKSTRGSDLRNFPFAADGFEPSCPELSSGYERWKDWYRLFKLSKQKWGKSSIDDCASNIRQLVQATFSMFDTLDALNTRAMDELRNQTSAQSRIIQRKQHVIHQFVQHQEKPRETSSAARYRECKYQL